jgi:hypothetical protein
MKTFLKNFIQKADYQYGFCMIAAMYFLFQIIFRY